MSVRLDAAQLFSLLGVSFTCMCVFLQGECVDSLRTKNPLTGTLANSDGQDEMDVYCLLRKKQSSEKEI